MELTEPVESINQQLIDLFGIDSITGLAIWRVVFSEEQFEKRRTEYSDGGILLLQPEVRLLPKYRQWIQEKYVLERLVLIPDVNAKELPSQKLSYEPIYVFEDSKGKYLPPKANACKFVIDTLYAAAGKFSMAKYTDPETEPDHKENRINDLQLELFGNETRTGDALAHGYGVTVPNSYERES